MALMVDEIFTSIQGEGYDSGLITTFVRLYGCNLKCKYCDQPQKKGTAKKMSVENLLMKIRSYHCTRVCITGGEPLQQPDIFPVIYDLLATGYAVSIETNGAIPLDDVPYNRSYKYVMDVKCPSSGMSTKNHLENLGILKGHDEVKFVISDRRDYDFARMIMRDYPTKAKILFSPVMNKVGDKWVSPVSQDLCEWVQKDRLFHVKIQCQIHKFLGVL